MKYAFIHDHRTPFPVTRMCQVLEVAPSGYYAWHRRPPSRRQQANDVLVCKALGFLDTYLVFSPPPQRTGFGVCLGGPAPVFYSRAAARSTVHCRRA